jgi:heptosyltransferase-2
MQKPSALYVRLPNWIGDVCMSLPCLDTLLATGIPVVVCARGWARDLLAAYPLDGFVEMTGRWRADRAAVSDHRKLARHAHPRGLLLPDSLSSAMVFRFAGIPSAGYRDDGRSLILRWPVHKPKPRPHAVQSWHYLTEQALKRWQLPCTPLPSSRHLNLKLLERHQQEAQQALEEAGLEAGQFVLVAPTATGLHKGKIKVWPHFNALVNALQDQGYRVAMCPPPNERQEALDKAPTAHCLTPLKLGAFAALAQMASVVVCNDSGVSHIAAAADARQLTLFGVTEHERTGPWSERALCLGSAKRWPTFDEVRNKVVSLLANPA